MPPEPRSVSSRRSSAGAVTVGDWIAYAESRFRAARLHFGHGTTSAGEEAAWLVSAVSGTPYQDLGHALSAPLASGQQRRASRLIEERIRTRTPLAYLLGEAWLAGHRFRIDRRVIVPRSFIAELIAQRIRPWLPPHRRIGNALDMCTGSGCLAILLALAFRTAQVDAVDLSAPALAVARRNISDYRLEARVRTVQSDLFDALEDLRYDIIVANPPYVDRTGMTRLPAEHRHEPRTSLAGGLDGLDFIRRILRDARRHLKRRGLLIVESGHNRGALERAFPAQQFTWLQAGGGEDHVFLLDREQLPA